MRKLVMESWKELQTFRISTWPGILQIHTRISESSITTANTVSQCEWPDFPSAHRLSASTYLDQVYADTQSPSVVTILTIIRRFMEKVNISQSIAGLNMIRTSSDREVENRSRHPDSYQEQTQTARTNSHGQPKSSISAYGFLYGQSEMSMGSQN